MAKSVAVECRWPLAVLAARHCAQISSDLRPCCLDRARYIHTPLTWDEPLLCQFWPVSFSREQTANFTFMIHMNYMCALDQNKLTNLTTWPFKQPAYFSRHTFIRFWGEMVKIGQPYSIVHFQGPCQVNHIFSESISHCQPVPPNTNQYRPQLTQYHQVTTSTALNWPSITM